MPSARFLGNVCRMSAVELAVKKVRNCLLPRRGNCGMAGQAPGQWKACQTASPTLVAQWHGPPAQGKIKAWLESVPRNDRLGAASNVRRTGQTISAVNFVLDTNAVSETRKSRPNPGLLDWVNAQDISTIPAPGEQTILLTFLTASSTALIRHTLPRNLADGMRVLCAPSDRSAVINWGS